MLGVLARPLAPVSMRAMNANSLQQCFKVEAFRELKPCVVLQLIGRRLVLSGAFILKRPKLE